MQVGGPEQALTKLSLVQSEIRKIRTEFFIKITLGFLKLCLSHIFDND